ncbi:glycosyltransferase [Paenibacillus sp. RC67]|uniref:glycosyltransferase n=1 Tax=Paenibacillus sp. RC67 TaxID=3039392 RepID=UPI0024AE57ED|nr:glycosyltransferase [Paenibacillus sp. RC67]
MIITLKWHIKNRKANEKMVLTSFNYSPLSLGILIISKLFGIKRANFFTDLSTDIINNKRQKDIVFIKRILLPLYLKLVKYIESNYDLYILFTKPMNTRVNPKNKPYLVMEGIYNNELELSKVQKKKAIMYAGTLSHEYGIKNILDAFEQLEDNEIELWLFGDGDMKKYINDICLRDQRIQFFGFRPHEEVFKYEKMATLLINVRNSDEEYTAYSFPSKTFEYMVSGTPFLTTKLKGIPEEYYSYLYTIESTNATSLKHKIEEIFTKPEYELKNFGLRAREFILNEKNSDIQAKRIVEFIREKFECVE